MSEVNELLETDIAFSKMSREKGVAEAFNANLEDGAIQLPSGESPIIGRQKIYESMKHLNEATDFSWEPQGGEVSQSGDIGYTWGTYKIVPKDGSGETKVGKYLNVWKRQTGGSWKVRIDMGNSSQ